MRLFAIRLPRFVVVAAALLLATILGSSSAEAHGGRVKPAPPPRSDGVPPTPNWPDAPPTPPPTTPGWPSSPPTPPTTPPSPAPTPGGPGGGVPPAQPPTPAPPTGGWPTPPTTPAPDPGGGNPTPPASAPPSVPPTGSRPGNALGRKRPLRSGPSDGDWQIWWELNRWRYFPERGVRLHRTGAVVTPRTPAEEADERALAARRRDLVARQHVLPFLLRQLDPARKVRDEIRAASLIALAKLSNEEETVALLLRYAENADESHLVRESAALATGFLRRSEAARRMGGDRVDAVRTRLLALLDDRSAPVRTRAFAALAIGSLGDQPHGSSFSKDGRVITRCLWTRLGAPYFSREIPVAILTAIGMQPAAGTSDEIKQGLQRITFGRRLFKHKWDDYERAHALNALIRQEGDGWPVVLFRTVTTKRLPAPVRRAAFIALGANASSLSPADRLSGTEAALKGIRYGRDSLTRGLGQIALGRILGADLADRSTIVLDRTNVAGYLVGEAKKGSQPVRGFAALAIALAARDIASEESSALQFGREVSATLLEAFERTGDPDLRGAYAVALGVVRDASEPVVAALTATLADRKADAALRGHAALSLGQLGARTPDVTRALRTALWDKRHVALRSETALALSFLGGRAETTMLVQELRNARSQWVLSQIAAALGQLGDLKAVAAILEVAGDERRADEARALAIASLGLLVDPEPKPSALRLTVDSNYPARTDALHEAFTIL